MSGDLSATTLNLSTLPVGVLVGLGVVVLVEVGLDVIALVDLYRRPVERLALGNKWVWVAIIVLVNLVGSILYLAVGRKPASLPGDPSQVSTPPQNKANIGDALYGPRDDSDHP